MKQIKTFWEPQGMIQAITMTDAEQQCNKFLKENAATIKLKRVEHIFNNAGSYMGLTIHYIDKSNDQQ
jgi:hypothetical protein